MLSGRPILATRLDRELFVDFARQQDRLLASVSRRLNCLIVGTRRSGKTSLLNVLARELEARFDVVRIDGRLPGDVRSFLSLLVYALARDRPTARARTALDPAALAWPFPDHPARGETEENLALLEGARRSIADRDLGAVILVDELRPDLGHQLFGRMRDEIWSLGATWIVATDADSKATLLRPPADAFFDTVVEVPSLDREESIELLRRRLRDEQVDDESLGRLADLAGGIPGRLVELARETVIEGVNPADAASRRAQLHGRAVRISDAARRLVEDLMAHGPASASDEALLARLNWSRGRATQVFKLLEDENIVRASTDRRGGGARKVYELAYEDE
ncbi:MAG: ATP-binding protein [Actinomycetota bacterium]|nr:ATP-binding protein [Actinomycetota bacterium]